MLDLNTICQLYILHYKAALINVNCAEFAAVSGDKFVALGGFAAVKREEGKEKRIGCRRKRLCAATPQS
ncbi:MAG: hypothetical protein ACI4RP_01695 [Acutalibacteraceae bacterium]